MATDFGFYPVNTGLRYFISYNTEDAARVKPIAKALYDSGYQLWYDYGLDNEKDWERLVSENIEAAEAVIMFITAGVFKKERTLVRRQYDLAKVFGTRIVPIYIDNINAERITERFVDFWIGLKVLHGIQMSQLESLTRLVSRISHALIISSSEAPYTSELNFHSEKEPKKSVGYNRLRIGDIFSYGRYPQSDERPEPIEWRVLSVESGLALVISKYSIDNLPYHKTETDVTWEMSDLRSWLNSIFINTAFNEMERSCIQAVRLINSDNPERGTKGGNATQDKLFCLSIGEATQHFDNDDLRVAEPTVFAESHGAMRGKSWWWLRSPGYNNTRAACILRNGLIGGDGLLVTSAEISVRPVFYLNLNDASSVIDK